MMNSFSKQQIAVGPFSSRWLSPDWKPSRWSEQRAGTAPPKSAWQKLSIPGRDTTNRNW